MDLITAIYAFTATNNDPSFIFSLGPVERFLKNMSGLPLDFLHWAIWILIGVTLVYNIYSMVLRALTRLSDYRAKVALNKKTLNDTYYGKDIDSAIKKAFDSIPDNRGGHRSADTISNSDKRLNLFIEIVRNAEKHLDLKDWKFATNHSTPSSNIREQNPGNERVNNKIENEPIHDFIVKFIENLEGSPEIEPIKSLY